MLGGKDIDIEATSSKPSCFLVWNVDVPFKIMAYWLLGWFLIFRAGLIKFGNFESIQRNLYKSKLNWLEDYYLIENLKIVSLKNVFILVHLIFYTFITSHFIWNSVSNNWIAGLDFKIFMSPFWLIFVFYISHKFVQQEVTNYVAYLLVHNRAIRSCSSLLVKYWK